MENKNKIHLKLTDNKTGQVLFDADGDFVLGAFCVDERQTMGMLAGRATPAHYLTTLQALDTLKERLYKEVPELKKMYELFKVLEVDKKATELTEIDLSAILKNKEQNNSEV